MSTSNGLAIAEGTEITLHFALRLEDGSLIDSNFDGEPARFVFGDGNLLPGFEAALRGLVAQDHRTLTIEPEQGFGLPNPNNIQQIARKQFPAEVTPEVGLVLNFADAQQAELPGVIIDVQPEWVFVDFNHPLAGKRIAFEVHILAVTAAVTH
jgi:FKBP-type peptidyl-prolyl cis-trans isomerase SlpA